MIVCETAKKCFFDILNVVGGPNEKIRAKKLLEKVTILPDLTETERDSIWSGKKLCLGKKIRQRILTILSFGLFHGAVTVTANRSALESARKQVNISKFSNLCYNEFSGVELLLNVLACNTALKVSF